MATEEDEIAQITPPVAVALIDSFLHELSASHLVTAARAADMLLDVRRTVWVPTELAQAVGPVMDQNAANKRPVAPGRPAR